MVNKITYAPIIYVTNKRVRASYRVIMVYRLFRNNNDVTVSSSFKNCHFYQTDGQYLG